LGQKAASQSDTGPGGRQSMDPERERVQSDLRGLLSGEVRCDDLFVQLYASDASIYQIPPLGVVRPRSTADVVALVRYAAENRIPLHARGAGSGLAGDSLGPGLVIDFSYSMRRVIEYGENTVRIQPGVVLSLLNRELASFGRTFGPDPAMSAVTTMGSVLAIDGSGSHWLKHGSARRHVVSMQVVLSDGEVCELGRHAISASGANGDARPRELAAQVASLVERHAEIIAERQPKSLVNRCGYHLHDIVADGHVDLARLMVGSEGTLALITEATVATEPLAGHVGVALLFFDRLEFAARAALEVPPMGASACDLMDRRVLTIAREVDPRFGPILPAEAEAALLWIDSAARCTLRSMPASPSTPRTFHYFGSLPGAWCLVCTGSKGRPARCRSSRISPYRPMRFPTFSCACRTCSRSTR
jgi:FAD/FMN-containing dehydrogenase